jgi:YL1 nuclear protein
MPFSLCTQSHIVLTKYIMQAAAPKKVRIESRSFTQAELIARALDNEEGNIVEHRDYLKIEEEKRKRARVVRATIEGPLLRWVSKGEEVKIIVPPPLPPPIPAFSNYSRPGQAYYYAPYTATSGSTQYGQGAYPYVMGSQAMQIPAGTYVGALNYTPTAPTPNAAPSTSASTPTVSRSATPTLTAAPSTNTVITAPSTLAPTQPSTSQTKSAVLSSMQPPPQSQPLFQPTNYIPYSPQVTEAITSSTGTLPSVLAAPEPQPTERTEKVVKNYVVHELSQYEGVPKPSWTDTMGAMFGDHIKWEELRVYVGKNRPLCMNSFPFHSSTKFSRNCLNSATKTDLSNHWKTCEIYRSTYWGSLCGCEGV